MKSPSYILSLALNNIPFKKFVMISFVANETTAVANENTANTLFKLYPIS